MLAMSRCEVPSILRITASLIVVRLGMVHVAGREGGGKGGEVGSHWHFPCLNLNVSHVSVFMSDMSCSLTEINIIVRWE